MARKSKSADTHVHITPAGLEKLCTEIWTPATWRARFSEVTGISYSQLHRYMTAYNGQRIPQVVVLALEGVRLLGKSAGLFPVINQYRAPIADAVAVRFNPATAKAEDKTPVADFFDDVPETQQEAPQAPVEPPPVVAPAKAPPSLAKSSAKLGKALAPKPAKPVRNGTAGTGTENGKVKERTGKKTAPTPPPAKAPVPKRPRRAALAKA